MQPAGPTLDVAAWVLALLATLAAAGVWAWLRARIWGPLRTVRRAARELAEGRPADIAALRAVDGPLGPTARDLARSAERNLVVAAQFSDETRNLRTILESLTEGVLIVDPGQIVRSANARLERMFDLSQAPAGRSVLEVFRNADVRDAVTRALAGEPTSRNVTLDVRGADGRYAPKHFDLVAVGLRASAEASPSGAILVLHDITELKNLESVRREFVANVSHELRTPLALINGYVETLLDPDALADPELVGQALGVMQKHGARLNELVEDLLTISRFEHGRGGLELAEVALGDALERVLDRLGPIVDGKAAEVVRSIPADLPPLRADPKRLDQVLFNLLENAIKYGPPSGLRIEVVARLDGEMAAITVRDNGPGIPQSDLPHVFERFYRVHKDRSREAGGSGLGLSIVKHLTQAHGGRVAAESVLGQGAVFRLAWPVAVGPGAAEEGGAAGQIRSGERT